MRLTTVALLVMAVTTLGCGGADGAASGSPPQDHGATNAPGTGMPADGGLSVEEAVAGEVRGPVMVEGFLVAEGEDVRLCQVLLESLPPQCGGASLRVENLDLSAYDTRSEGSVTWTDSPVSLLGEVHGDAIHVSETAM